MLYPLRFKANTERERTMSDRNFDKFKALLRELFMFDQLTWTLESIDHEREAGGNHALPRP